MRIGILPNLPSQLTKTLDLTSKRDLSRLASISSDVMLEINFDNYTLACNWVQKRGVYRQRPYGGQYWWQAGLVLSSFYRPSVH